MARKQDIHQAFSHQGYADGDRGLRYFTKGGQHCIATYLPAGEDIPGPHTVDRYDSIDEARRRWKEIAAKWKLKGLFPGVIDARRD